MSTDMMKLTKTVHKLDLIIIYRTFYLLNKAYNFLGAHGTLKKINHKGIVINFKILSLKCGNRLY